MTAKSSESRIDLYLIGLRPSKGRESQGPTQGWDGQGRGLAMASWGVSLRPGGFGAGIGEHNDGRFSGHVRIASVAAAAITGGCTAFELGDTTDLRPRARRQIRALQTEPAPPARARQAPGMRISRPGPRAAADLCHAAIGNSGNEKGRAS